MKLYYCYFYQENEEIQRNATMYTCANCNGQAVKNTLAFHFPSEGQNLKGGLFICSLIKIYDLTFKLLRMAVNDVIV